MTINHHSCQPIDKGTSGKNQMIEVRVRSQLTLLLRLGQQVDHLPANGFIDPEDCPTRRNQSAFGTDDLEMRGIGNRPFQIALSDCFEGHDGICAVDF